MQLIQIARTQDIPVGQMKGFTVENKQILVANVAGKYYAMDALCSHMHGYLPAGTLQNNIVICPVHRAQFDVTTGKVHKNVNAMIRLSSGGGAKDLNIYDLLVEGDVIKIKI
jgi:3-phenylpropionate/trans-cinnamate dioxygenase ferredoxin component